MMNKNTQIILDEWKERIIPCIDKRERYYIDSKFSCFMKIPFEIERNELKKIHQWLWDKFKIRNSFTVCSEYNDEYELKNQICLTIEKLTKPDTKFGKRWSIADIELNLKRWNIIFEDITEGKTVVKDWCHCGVCETERDLIVESHNKEEGWLSYWCTYCADGFYEPKKD